MKKSICQHVEFASIEKYDKLTIGPIVWGYRCRSCGMLIFNTRD